MRDISVIMPTFNRSDTVRQALESLIKQKFPIENYEIIVINDGSTDNTEEIVNSIIGTCPCKIKYFKQSNMGPAAARNVGVLNSEGKYVIFTGDDCIADRSLLEEHMKYHNKNENIAVLGNTITHPDLPKTNFMKYLENTDKQFAYHLINEYKSIPFYFFYTSNISIERKKIIDVGLFNEVFKYAAWEDIDLGKRLQEKLKVRIVFNEKAITYHYHSIKLLRYLRREYIRGQEEILFRKISFNGKKQNPRNLFLFNFFKINIFNKKIENVSYLIYDFFLTVSYKFGQMKGNNKYFE